MLGNTAKGDGPRYRGFGIIQNTGKANQRAAAVELGILDEWEEDPTILAKFPYAIFAAGQFWKAKGISAIANQDTGPGPARRKIVERVTRKVNGGQRALIERTQATERAFTELQRAASRPIARFAALSEPEGEESAPASGGRDLSPVPAASLSSDDAPAPIMLGDDGAGVENAQRRLVDLGYPLAAPDGRFGPATRAAILAFQADNDLETSGVLDDVTIRALFVAEKRPIVVEREETTADDLRAAGSRTVKSADRVSLSGKVLGYLGGFGLGTKTLDATGALDTAKGAVDQVSSVKSLYESASDVAGWVVSHWYVGALAAGVALVVFGRQIIAARVDDRRTGANLGR